MRTARDLEKIMKGPANHHRISMLYYIEKHPDSTTEEICNNTHTAYKTTSEHLRRLVIAGLISKHSDGNYVRHNPTNLGRSILTFLRKLE